jgi:hypothetical protein
MASVQSDLRYLQAGLIDLEGYLLSDELYWPIGASAPPGDPPYPRLTLGGILMASARLRSLKSSMEPRIEYERIENKLDVTRSKWRTAWEKKAAREFSSRLKLWRDFLEEYRRDPDANHDRYAYEVRRRLMLELLAAETQTPPAEQEMLHGLDQLLRSVFLPGEFILDRDQQPAFDPDRFWFLYGTVKKE